eukprot:3865636-Pleurochrysis_carterae.AAC.1
MPLRGLLLNRIRVQVLSRSTTITSGARFRFSTYDNNPISKINNKKSRTDGAQKRSMAPCLFQHAHVDNCDERRMQRSSELGVARRR